MENNRYDLKSAAEAIDELRSRFVVTQKRGLHFIIPSVMIWAVILVLQFLIPDITNRNLAVFCSSTMLMPLAFVTSKLLGIKFSDKENPLSSPGFLFTMNQMLYLTIVMWAFAANPQAMVMIYGIVFAAHLLPFGWLYRSKAYSVMSVFETAAALFSGIFGSARAVATVMTISQVVLVLWLIIENRKDGMQRNLYEKQVY